MHPGIFYIEVVLLQPGNDVLYERAEDISSYGRNFRAPIFYMESGMEEASSFDTALL